MKKWVLMSLLLLNSFLLAQSPFEFPNQEQIPNPDKIALSIIDQTVKSIEKKYDAYSIGFGMEGKFEYLEISFEICGPMNKDEARAILFDCIEEFLNNINLNKEIRQYLGEYPFNLKNVGIILYIIDKNHDDIYHPNICIARSSTSGVFFRTNDPDDTFKYKETYEETHEQALALVEKYRAENPHYLEHSEK